jgi:signal peptidase I
VIRNGARVSEPWVRYTDDHTWPDDSTAPPSGRARDHMAAATIAEDQLFCLGDNRDESQDSRVFGAVPRSTVRGRALVVYWSFDPSGVETARGFGRLFYLPLNFIPKTRWERQFMLVR